MSYVTVHTYSRRFATVAKAVQNAVDAGEHEVSVHQTVLDPQVRESLRSLGLEISRPRDGYCRLRWSTTVGEVL